MSHRPPLRKKHGFGGLQPLVVCDRGQLWQARRGDLGSGSMTAHLPCLGSTRASATSQRLRCRRLVSDTASLSTRKNLGGLHLSPEVWETTCDFSNPNSARMLQPKLVKPGQTSGALSTADCRPEVTLGVYLYKFRASKCSRN